MIIHILMQLLEYNLCDGVLAFSTMRSGGAGTGSYSGFNITHYCGDDPVAVARNREMLCHELGIEDSYLLLPRQTHGTECVVVDEALLAMAHEERERLLHGVDAIITAIPRLCIGVSTADCVPLLLCDLRKRVVAAVHAGWRGTVARIAEKALQTMSSRYGCNASDVRVVIAPSISPDAFEVGDEVYDAFSDEGFPMERIACRYGEKWHIDLWEANRLQLLECGVREESVEVCGICTFSNVERFFSARRLGIDSGRIFNGIMIE